MLNHLIVPLEAAATSFCYYENEHYAAGSSELLPIESLARLLDYARPRQLAVNFVYGRTPPPSDYADLIESVPHGKVVPLPLQGLYPEAMVVVNPQEVAQLSELAASEDLNVVLRLAKEQMTDFADLIASLVDKCRRINVILLGLEHYTDADFPVYEAQLRALLPLLVEKYQSGWSGELSCLTDRLFLTQMRNCDAGLAHLTVSPEGKLYLCPAFCSAEADDSVGSLAEGLALPNAQLLAVDHAPICSLCDAFHCKRCLWLNQQLTGEINTPSRQQCVLSHLEREVSRELVERLRGLEGFRHVPRIPQIDYLDPLELIQRAGGYPVPPDEAQRPSPAAPEAGTSDRLPPAPAQAEPGESPPSAGRGTRPPVGQVSPEERDEIRRLFERRSGLAELARSLAGMSQAELANSVLYDRIVTEMGEVATRFQAWWQEKAAQYGWESSPEGAWQIDFNTCAVYLAKPE